uniref:Uncharacterized protein n=1 Tax=Nelumbo nucifera TaxID=4432 RepID=A0A822YY93_NELNU|nr:TPA_asm: hypothetical protein HUJ06_006336 [Nelumbo nucifera]
MSVMIATVNKKNRGLSLLSMESKKPHVTFMLSSSSIKISSKLILSLGRADKFQVFNPFGFAITGSGSASKSLSKTATSSFPVTTTMRLSSPKSFLPSMAMATSRRRIRGTIAGILFRWEH